MRRQIKHLKEERKMKSRNSMTTILVLVIAATTLAFGSVPQITKSFFSFEPQANAQVSSDGFFDRLIQLFSFKKAESKQEVATFLQTPENVNLKAVEIPEEILWRVIFGFSERFKTAAEKAKAAGQDESLFTEYFTREAKLSVETAEIFKQKAAEYAAALEPLTERMQSIEDYRRAARDGGKKLPNEELYALKKELLELQQKRKEITLKYRDEFRQAINAASFASFENWLKTEFAAKFSSQKITSKDTPSKITPNSNLPNNGFESIEKIQKEGN
jgi:hypothetical protein